jgi:hypothetical protein
VPGAAGDSNRLAGHDLGEQHLQALDLTAEGTAVHDTSVTVVVVGPELPERPLIQTGSMAAKVVQD